MVIRRGAVVVCAVTVALSGSLVAQNRNQNQKEQQKQAPKLSNAQKADLATITQLIDGVAAGQPAPNDLSLTWARQDLLKAQGGKQYVPFMVTLDPAASAAAGKTLTVYWRVVAQGAAAAPVAPPAARKRAATRPRRRRRASTSRSKT